jgi:outer membrane protein OmpA-like peptidoglycan-associated protein
MSRALRVPALAGLVAAGLMLLASPPQAAANGWHGHCCYGGWGWGYPGWYGPRVGVTFGVPFPYYAPPYFAPAYYPRPYVYPNWVYPPPRVNGQVPLAPPPQQPYVVYFDFDRATLTADGRHVIDQAIAAAKAGGNPLIRVDGHTDTAGASDYNIALSNRRADAVADYMVAHGIPAEEIQVMGEGEQGLAVPTPDGVPNGPNRRVVILLGAPANVSSGYGSGAGSGQPMAPPVQGNANVGGEPNVAAADGGNAGDCQEFGSAVTIDGRKQQVFGRACRQADGSWKVVSQ